MVQDLVGYDNFAGRYTTVGVNGMPRETQSTLDDEDIALGIKCDPSWSSQAIDHRREAKT